MNRIKSGLLAVAGCAAASFLVLPERVIAHGDVAPQAVDTSGLPELGEEWLDENPWRDPKGEHWQRAIEVGASGYNQNCARCHGLGAVSGGLAPDLRFLEANMDGDEWYLERFQHGYTQNGITKMPAFGELLGQEAAWAIRTYIETRPDQDALEEHAGRMKELLGELETLASGDDLTKVSGYQEELQKISDMIPTGSGAPVSDSMAAGAARYLDGSKEGLHEAVNQLHIGLSAAE